MFNFFFISIIFPFLSFFTHTFTFALNILNIRVIFFVKVQKINKKFVSPTVFYFVKRVKLSLHANIYKKKKNLDVVQDT